MEKSFANFEIRVLRDGADAHRVEARLDDGSVFTGGRLELDKQRTLLAELDPEAYGMELFKALFGGKMRDALMRVLGRAEERTEGRLRVRLFLDPETPDLHVLPWERIYQIHKGSLLPLAATERTPFSRYVGVGQKEPKALRGGRLAMLAAFANPEGLPSKLVPLTVEDEVRGLWRALAYLVHSGRLRLTLMPGRSVLPGALRKELAGSGVDLVEGATSWDRIRERVEDHQVLHFMGHGHLTRSGDATVLHLEKEDGTWDPVKDDVVVSGLATLDPGPLLVFLAACETAKTAESRPPEDEEAEKETTEETAEAKPPKPTVGLGRRLVEEAGVPAVVAMQDLVPIDLASSLAERFYTGLFEHGVVDLALNRVRRLLFDSGDADWAIPVLFLRLAEGRLIEADPILTALEAIAAWSRDGFEPIAVEAVRIRKYAGRRAPDLPEDSEAPAAPVPRAIAAVFSRDPDDERDDPAHPRIAALVGSRGMTKSTQLRRVVHDTAIESQAGRDDELLLPLVVPLPNLGRHRGSLRNPAEAAILERLRNFSPGIEAKTLEELDGAHPGVRLRVFFDQGEELSDAERRDAWEQVQALAVREPGHDFLLAIERSQYDAARLGQVTDLLIIQRLHPRVIEDFLLRSGEPGQRLREALTDTEMFDLASLPWLLLEMLDQARREVVPTSRTQVLSDLVEQALSSIEMSLGLRGGAEHTLQRLALEMSSERADRWTVQRAFHLMADTRGHRGYDLEALYDQLFGCGLLSRLGDQTVLFAHEAVRASCCARAIVRMDEAERERLLDDIAASLGRPTRLHWWRETLILLAGLLPEPEHLLEKLVYGNILSQGELVFLIARCLQEALARPDGKEIDQALVDQVVSALAWRLDRQNERLTPLRARAAEELGRLRLPSTLPHLVRTTNQKVRPDWRGEMTYDLSIVRMTAGRALRRMVPEHWKAIANLDPELAKLLRYWQRGEWQALVKWMRTGPAGSRPIAAFALADMGSPNLRGPFESLVETFLAPGVQSATRWAVTEGLTLIDPELVRRRAIHPFLAESQEEAEALGLPAESWRQRSHWYERLAYLIGKTRLQDPKIDLFLERCLGTWKTVGPKARAIQSIGWMQDSRYKSLLESIALDDLGALALGDTVSDDHRSWLRQSAIEALGSIGDRETLDRLRRERSGWSAGLDRALYRATEEIVWRERRAEG